MPQQLLGHAYGCPTEGIRILFTGKTAVNFELTIAAAGATPPTGTAAAAGEAYVRGRGFSRLTDVAEPWTQHAARW
jgi:hypothetical protein